MTINIICAMDKNRAIGYQSKLLTYLPNDLKYFKSLTEDSICVMGRVTYESIISQLGKPLPNRNTIVLTNDYTYNTPYDNVAIYHSIGDIVYDHIDANNQNEIFICGGSQIYNEFLPYADVLYLTIINHEFTEADSYFPEIDDEWKFVTKIINKADDKNLYNHHFITYEKLI